MANHHVRDGASGSNDGTDWTNAFATLPATLTRGDTYYIADGDYVAYTFNDTVSGTTRIFIKKAIESDHGSSTGWLSSYGDGQAIFQAIVQFTTDYFTFDGQVRTTRKSGHGFKVDNKTTTKPQGINVPGADNITFRYVEIEGPQLDYHTDDGGPISFGVEGWKLITSVDCVIQFSYAYNDGVSLKLGSAQRLLVEHSTFGPNSHSTSAHAEAVSDEGGDDYVFRYNHFEDIEGTGTIIVLDKGTGGTESNNWEIYGNVFMYHDGNPFNRSGNGNGAIAVINNETANDWKIYNNSFISMKYGSSPNARISFVASVGSGHEIFNNIWFDSDEATHSGTFTADWNWYFSTTHTTETNEQAGSGDPFVDWVNEDFHLSAATNAGTDTGASLPGNDFDMDGVERGADGTWDRGAFEFVAGDSWPPHEAHGGDEI